MPTLLLLCLAWTAFGLAGEGMPNLPVVIAPMGGIHTATLIFLHGLGDSGHGWSSSLRVLCKKFTFLKVICPHA